MTIQNAKTLPVLVIDDQPLAQNYLKYSLESFGFGNVRFCERAQEAINLCKQTQYELILCAYNLSRDKNGYQLYEELKAKRLIRLTTAFIFISAETDQSLVHSVIELAPDDFLVKPFTLQELGKRIERVLKRKQVLHSLYDYIDVGNFSKAIRTIRDLLKDSAMARYVPLLLRLQGDVYLLQRDFDSAIEFFRSVINVQPFTWAKLGLIESFMCLERYEEAQDILVPLLERPDARVACAEYLAKILFLRGDYQQAQSYLQQATKLAPRNLLRQQHLSNLSRLTHDHEQRFKTQRDIAKYARHSMHESPEFYLNAARAGIDLALTQFESDSQNKILRQTMEILNDLRNSFPGNGQKEQLDVLNARLHFVKDERDKAVDLISDLLSQPNSVDNIEDSLDKAKAFHELGFHRQAEQLFNDIADHCSKLHSPDPVLSAYVTQEQMERNEIKVSPKELNNVAVGHYQSGNIDQAYRAFSLAFRIMPKNPSIALNLLQTIEKGKLQLINAVARSQVNQATELLDSSKLTKDQEQRFEKLKEALNANRHTLSKQQGV